MPGSLRFRLPALLLLGIILGGFVAAAVALRLFQDLTRDSSLAELRREASGITQLYAAAALRSVEEGADAPDFATDAFERATGDDLYYVGAPAFPGQESGLVRLPESALPEAVRESNAQTVTFTFTPPGESRPYLAVAELLRLEPGTQPLGRVVVAKPERALREQWEPLLRRLVLAFTVGSLLAWAVGWWMSQRITRPVLALARASSEIAAGNYAVRVPGATGTDEIAYLSDRFNEMAARLEATEERERQFLMSVSHELRTPLTAIKGHVDAMQDGLIADADAVEGALETISSEATRLERLVGDIVDLAKLRAHRFTVHAQEVDMGRLVDHAHGAFVDEALRRGLDYRLERPADAPVLETDGDRVLQIIVNLLKNAFRWTPDSGAITLRLTVRRDDVLVQVTDSGAGISRADQERVFSPFVSADTQGTGLGLPIARELAGALGGSVEVESVVGRGSTFSLRLPRWAVLVGPEV